MKKFIAAALAAYTAMIVVTGCAWARSGSPDDAQTAKGGGLIDAIKSGDYSLANKLVAAGGGTDARDANGDTALVFAVARRRADLVKALLAAGADVNNRNSEGWTPLMSAVTVGSEEIVKLLLDSGADPLAEADLKGAGKRTPVSLAKIKKNKKILALLEARPSKKPRAETNSNAASGENPFLNDAMISDGYECSGSEWNEDAESGEGKFRGGRTKDEDPEYALTAKLGVSKFYEAKGGTVYKFQFKFDSDLESTKNYGALYFYATGERIYEVYLPDENIDEYVKNRILPEIEESDLRCVRSGSYEGGENPKTTIKFENGSCRFDRINEGNGNFARMDWREGQGLVYLATGRGAHRVGWRLKIGEKK